jgi:hypothetical protein
MKHIVAEGVEYWYLKQNEDLSVLDAYDVQGQGVDTFMRERLPRMSNVRVVLIQYVLRHPWFEVHYLFWGDNPDLNVLDQKVEDGSYIDDDFFFSILTYHLRLMCPRCKRKWDTLSIGHGDCYWRARAVGRGKGLMYPGKHCPVCGCYPRAEVVHFFEDVEQTGALVVKNMDDLVGLVK